jgi:hypothetical protein
MPTRPVLLTVAASLLFAGFSQQNASVTPRSPVPHRCMYLGPDKAKPLWLIPHAG